MFRDMVVYVTRGGKDGALLEVRHAQNTAVIQLVKRIVERQVPAVERCGAVQRGGRER